MPVGRIEHVVGGAVTRTEVEQDGKRFAVRSAPRPAASVALRAVGAALPPTVEALAGT